MFVKPQTTIVGLAFLAQVFLPVTTLAQASPSSGLPQPPTSAQISSLASVGVNTACAKAFLSAHANTPPRNLNELNQFIATAPAADLCSGAAVQNAMQPGGTPTPAQIGAYTGFAGVNASCTTAFVTQNHALPQSLAELTLFATYAPAPDLCTPDAIRSAVQNLPTPTETQMEAFAGGVGVNLTCVKAFVTHNNTLPQNIDELNQFIQLAPPQYLCS